MAKRKFKIINWPTYNKVLKELCSLTVWIDESSIALWTEKTSPEERGRLLHYSDMAITTALNDETSVWPFSKGFTGLRR